MQSSGRKASSLREQAVPTIRAQALKLQHTSVQAFPQRLKLQARVHKLQDPSTRVQAYKLWVRGTSNKDKGIQIMFHVKANLMGGKAYFVN